MIALKDYDDHATLTEKLRTLAGSPVIDRSVIGESPGGRELWCATAAGPDARRAPSDRPALLVTANMHAREYAGSWTALQFLDRLAEEYREDSTVTDLLNRRSVYVIPRVCPDGAEFTLETRTKKCRSRFIDLEPADVREPNTVIPGDITGDGRILFMRWPADDGDRIVPDDEPRLTLPRPDDVTDGTFYRGTVEGRVANYDGGRVSEASMRSDFNRNFPSDAWRPVDWIGHGEYPLSEPETRAVADFVLDHPNIVGVADLHTGNPAIFHPAALEGDDVDHPGDASLLHQLGERGEDATGFPYLAGYYEASGGDPYILHGSFKDWAYERIGVPAYVVEHGMLYNSLGFDTADLAMDSRDHKRATREALLQYQDDHPDRPVFHEWQSVDHPELGEVEVGGFDWATLGSPATEDMPEIAANVGDWLLDLLEWAPEVRIDPDVEPLDGDLVRLSAIVRNTGRLSTQVTDRGPDTIQDAAPIAVLEGGELVAGRRRQEVGHLPEQGGSDRLEWILRRNEEVQITIDAARGASAQVGVDLTE